MRALSDIEIQQVSGGLPGYQLQDGSSFTWTGPNGIQYQNVTFVGSTSFIVDGNREYFSDYFAMPTYPMPDLQGFMNAITAAGSPPVYVSI